MAQGSKGTTTTCSCGHRTSEHSSTPALDGRTGCLAAAGLARCTCLATFECQCENSTCAHGADRCTATDVRPAPVMFLEGSDMCEPCITSYIMAGYFLPESPYALSPADPFDGVNGGAK